jgi:hypothetical protein
MALAYHFDDADGIVRLRASGTLTSEDVLATVRELEADKRIKRWRAMFDMTDVDDVGTNADFVRTLAQLRGNLSYVTPDAKVAIVATSDVAFGMARMYSQFVDQDDQVRVFRALAEAESWLTET